MCNARHIESKWGQTLFEAMFWFGFLVFVMPFGVLQAVVVLSFYIAWNIAVMVFIVLEVAVSIVPAIIYFTSCSQCCEDITGCIWAHVADDTCSLINYRFTDALASAYVTENVVFWPWDWLDNVQLAWFMRRMEIARERERKKLEHERKQIARWLDRKLPKDVATVVLTFEGCKWKTRVEKHWEEDRKQCEARAELQKPTEESIRGSIGEGEQEKRSTTAESGDIAESHELAIDLMHGGCGDSATVVRASHDIV